ncbi:hypothetical protein AB91_5468 [Escherichia coli 2-460-02_S3_C1]|nr:hypothetical protein AB91_5468 [Escherichia coli 2-460-02_S3_C1]KDY55107.1 hypothetical protein AC20_5372 [Escherichia coli 2-460-02_S3_C2]
MLTELLTLAYPYTPLTPCIPAAAGYPELRHIALILNSA